VTAACRRPALCAAGAVLAAVAAPAAAQPSGAGAPVEVARLNPVQLFQLATDALAKGRAADAEAVYRALLQDRDLEVRTEARFRLALLLSQQGRHADAAVLLRRILDDKPRASRVRLELARLLALMGREREARRALRQAEASGLPRDVQLAVDQFRNALRSVQPYGGSFEVALAPDTNLNRATASRTLDTIIAPLDLSRDAREQSGVGLRLSGQAFARVPLGSRVALVPRLSAEALLYSRSRFDDVSGAALVGLEWRVGKDRLTPSIGETYRLYGNRPYAWTDAATVAWLHPAGRKAQVEASLSASRIRNRRNPLESGSLYDASAAYERALSQRWGASLAVSATRLAARDPGYSTASGGVTLLSWHDFGRLTGFASVGMRRLEADARLFPFTERRRDWLVRATGGATFRRLTVAGFAPVVRVTAERNASTVGIYGYRRLAFDLGLTRAF